MKTVLIEGAIYLLVFGLGAWTWPMLRMRLILLRNDPVGTIEKDIAALREVAEAIKKRVT